MRPLGMWHQLDEGQTSEGVLPESGKFSRQLNSKNKITAINTLAVSVLVYSFRLVNWVRKETAKMDRKMRKLVSVEEINYMKAHINRLYIKRWNGGAGWVELESTYNATTIGLSAHIKQGKDWLTRLVQEYDARRAKYSLQKKLI